MSKGLWELDLGTSPELFERMPSLFIKFTKLKEYKPESSHLPVVVILTLQVEMSGIFPNKVKLSQETERPDALLALFMTGRRGQLGGLGIIS